MKSRLLELDVLRAIAIFLILGRHMPLIANANYPYPIGIIFKYWNKSGWIGVDLFFVLSGFLISGLLFREYSRYGHLKIDRFLIRRGFKIYPAFYVFMAISIIWMIWQDYNIPDNAILTNLLFLQNYGPRLWNHTWSLAVEEHFYFFIPVLFLYLSRKKKDLEDPFRAVKNISIVFVFVMLFFRLITVWYYDYSPYGGPHNIFLAHIYPTHLRMDGLMFGVFLSYYFHFRRASVDAFAKRYSIVALPLSFILVATSLIFSITGHFMYTVGFTLIYLGFGIQLILLIVWQSAFKDRLFNKLYWFARIGFYSYSIYLWHLPFKKWGLYIIVPKIFGARLPYIIEWPIFIVGSIVIGIVMAKIIELPALKLRDRFYPSRSKELAGFVELTKTA